MDIQDYADDLFYLQFRILTQRMIEGGYPRHAGICAGALRLQSTDAQYAGAAELSHRGEGKKPQGPCKHSLQRDARHHVLTEESSRTGRPPRCGTAATVETARREHWILDQVDRVSKCCSPTRSWSSPVWTRWTSQQSRFCRRGITWTPYNKPRGGLGGSGRSTQSTGFSSATSAARRSPGVSVGTALGLGLALGMNSGRSVLRGVRHHFPRPA